MAKDVKDDSNKEDISADDLRRVIAEAVRQKQAAAEYNSNAATVTRGAVERYGLEKTAFTFTRRLSELEEAKRDAIVLASLDYWELMGFLDGGLFPEEMIDRLKAIIERNHNTSRRARGAADKAVDDALLN